MNQENVRPLAFGQGADEFVLIFLVAKFTERDGDVGMLRPIIFNHRIVVVVIVKNSPDG